jgi:type IV pilus assembly protein PilY1
VYVLGLAVNDVTGVTRLTASADSGCTGPTAECENGDPDGNQALFASDLNSLRESVQSFVEASNRPVSRTFPVFALSNNPDVPQYQFTTALRLPTESGEPWKGILERRRWDCGRTPEPGFATLNEGQGDLFHEELNKQTSARKLFTSFPTSGSPNLEGVINKTTGSCGLTACPLIALSNGSIVTDAVLGGVTPAVHQQIVAWMYGDAGTVREDARLGAIYHSSPVIVGPPSFDTADANYNAFRRDPLVATRPQILYIGTNDGILHAISTGDYNKPATAPLSWGNLADGEELWGFIPPMLLNDLGTSMTTHQGLMDGTPVVKNVNVDALLGAAGYKTILVTGMREGGNAYVALDVTDPFNPAFLWQVGNPLPSPTPPNAIAKTYGKPAIIQARFRRPPPGGGTDIIKDGAIAVLPGGVGNLAAGSPGCNGASNDTMRNGAARFDTLSPQPDGTTPPLRVRADVQCWGPAGRSLTFVDVQDGYIVKTIHLQNPTQSPSTSNEPVFTAPLVSAPAAFPDEIGVISTRLFITDADGLIWRIDMRGEGGNDPVPDDPMRGWTPRPFHDIFWDLLPNSGELTYEAPMLSIDTQGRPVVIVGTGDTGDFVKPTVGNRIVSLTEVETASAVDSPLHYKASLNWEIRERGGAARTTAMTDGTAITVDGLKRSELVTGPMGLFEGQLYVGTFIAVTDSTEVCDLGRGRIHAVDYVQRDFVDSNGSNPNTYGPYRVNAGSTETTNIVNIRQGDSAGDNIMILGITVAQRPS